MLLPLDDGNNSPSHTSRIVIGVATMSMYNAHRGMGPAPGNARLNEMLDGIRAEFETQARASGEYEHQSTFPFPCSAINNCHCTRSLSRIIYEYSTIKNVILTLFSCSTDAGDADGPRKSLPNGANSSRTEAEVSCTFPSIMASCAMKCIRN